LRVQAPLPRETKLSTCSIICPLPLPDSTRVALVVVAAATQRLLGCSSGGRVTAVGVVAYPAASPLDPEQAVTASTPMIRPAVIQRARL
jgi:hypothetical protein